MSKKANKIKKGDYVYLTREYHSHELKTTFPGYFVAYRIVEVLDKEVKLFDIVYETTFMVKKEDIQPAKEYISPKGSRNAKIMAFAFYMLYLFCFVGALVVTVHFILIIIGIMKGTSSEAVGLIFYIIGFGLVAKMSQILSFRYRSLSNLFRSLDANPISTFL